MAAKELCVRRFLLLLSIAVLPPSARPYAISNYIIDTVSGGQIKHITIQTPSLVVLISSEGDTDLYASPTQKNRKPPSSEDHDLSSTSCGLDVLSFLVDHDTKYTVGVYGHTRFKESKFFLYIIEPNNEDIRKHQIWEWDPEKKREIMVIDADPMVLMNDPQLNELILYLQQDSGTGGGGAESNVKRVAKNTFEYAGIVLLKLLEILVEILV